jgi:aminoglycoside 6'-N-acetyltransferase
MAVGPTLRGERVLLRPLEERDFARLVEIGSEPEVARWWPGIAVAELAEKAAGEEEDTVALAVESEGRVVGMIQFHEETTPSSPPKATDRGSAPMPCGRSRGTCSRSAATTG